MKNLYHVDLSEDTEELKNVIKMLVKKINHLERKIDNLNGEIEDLNSEIRVLNDYINFLHSAAEYVYAGNGINLEVINSIKRNEVIENPSVIPRKTRYMPKK